MADVELDDIDRRILALLQTDARNNTNVGISERIGVAASTVGKRIKQLEEAGIIKGYHPTIDYARADFPLHVLFICTTTINDRSALIQEVLEIPGVVGVRELMTGRSNVHVEVVGTNNEDITNLAWLIGVNGLDIIEEILVKNEYRQPASVFGCEYDR